MECCDRLILQNAAVRKTVRSFEGGKVSPLYVSERATPRGLIEFPKLPLALDFINRGFDIWNRCQILWPRRALFHGENLSEGEDAYRAPFKVNHDAARKQILVGSSAVDSA